MLYVCCVFVYILFLYRKTPLPPPTTHNHFPSDFALVNTWKRHCAWAQCILSGLRHFWSTTTTTTTAATSAITGVGQLTMTFTQQHNLNGTNMTALRTSHALVVQSRWIHLSASNILLECKWIICLHKHFFDCLFLCIAVVWWKLWQNFRAYIKFWLL